MKKLEVNQLHKSSLMQLLGSLNEREVKQFGKFINSVYHNTNHKIIELYDVLLEYYPGFDAAELSRQSLFRSLYGNRKFVEGTMKYLFSEMETLVKQFITGEKTEELMSDVVLLKELMNRNLNRLFEKHYNSVKKKLSIYSDHNNLYNFLIAETYRFYLDRHRLQLTKKDLFKAEWFKPMDETMKFFLKTTLENIVFLSNYKKNVNDKIDIPAMNVLEFIEKEKKYRDDKDILIYLLQIKMLTGNDENSFLKLKRMLDTNESLSDEQKISIINNLQYYYTSKLLSGEDYNREELELIKLRIRHKIFIVDKKISIDLFYKTFMLAIALRDFKWAEKFLKTYSCYLDKKYRDNALRYGHGRLLYQEKEYDKALAELSKIKNYTFIHYKPAVKILQMMIYFDLKLFIEAEDSVKTFLQFLRNDKLIPSDIKKAYLTFTKIYSKLLNGGFNLKPAKVNELKFLIHNQKELLIGRKWFLERLEVI